MIIGISGKIGSGKDTVGKIIQYLTAQSEAEKDINMPDREYWINMSYEDYFKHNMIAHNWQIKKFADKSTESFKSITGIDYRSISREEKEKIRPLYVKYAEDCKEIFGKDVWVNSLMNVYRPDIDMGFGVKWDKSLLENNIYKDQNGKEYIAKYPNWIISDLRFSNELEAVKARKGITIRVNRYCYDSAEDFLVTHPDKNISKIGIDINMNENNSVIDFEEPARIHGYKPLSEQHPSEKALDNAEFDYTILNNDTIEDLIQKVKDILIKENII